MIRIRTYKKLAVRVTLVAALALASSLASAAPRKAAPRQPDKIPARIILTWAGDPTRTQAVTWRTAAPADNPQGQVAVLTGSSKVEEAAATVKGTSIDNEHYCVRFQDLKPGLKYCYRVGDGTTWSEWNVFRTASDRPEPFRFIYLGDAQNDIHSLWSRTIRIAYATAPDARFIIHAGDLVTDGYDDRLWGEWCEALGFISAMVPSMPVPGNHDLHPAPDSTGPKNPLTVPATWRQHFTLPMNGPEGLQGQSYYIDYQGARFVSLDVNVFTGKVAADGPKKQLADKQLAWLDKVLRENRNRWTVVFQHQPVYPIARDRDANQMESVLAPVYDKYHVDLVLAGHDHSYGRTYKLRASRVVSEEEPGTVYAVSVSGPKMYELTVAKPELMAKTLPNTQLFQIISIDGDRLQFRAYSIDGSLIDSFDLRKDKLGARKN